MTSSEDLKDVRDVFIRWDTNQDGVLTIEELYLHMRQIFSHFGVAVPDIMKMIHAADMMKDGKISYDEFLAAATDKNELLSDTNLRRVFSTLDRNNSDKIEKASLAVVMQRYPEISPHLDDVWDTLVANTDSEGTTSISFQDF